MITMPLSQLPLSQLPAQNPQRPVTSGHTIWGSVHPFSHTSLRALVCPLLGFFVVFTKGMGNSLGGSLSQTNSTTPPFPEKVLDCFHSAYSCFHLILAWPFTQSTTVLQSSLISSVGSFPATSILSSRGSRSLGCSVGKVPLGSYCFSTACFMDSSKLRITSSSRGFFCVIGLIRSFPSPAHLAIGAHCAPRLWNPPCASTVEHHQDPTPYRSRSPPRSCSPFQNGTKSQHIWDITVIQGPRHCGPKFARHFLGQQRQALFFQLVRMDRDVLIL